MTCVWKNAHLKLIIYFSLSEDSLVRVKNKTCISRVYFNNIQYNAWVYAKIAYLKKVISEVVWLKMYISKRVCEIFLRFNHVLCDRALRQKKKCSRALW